MVTQRILDMTEPYSTTYSYIRISGQLRLMGVAVLRLPYRRLELGTD